MPIGQMAAAAKLPSLLVLFASQTGTAQVRDRLIAGHWLSLRMTMLCQCGQGIDLLWSLPGWRSQDVAERVARQAENRGLAVSYSSMDDFMPHMSTLPSEPRVVFVASTTGDGDPPDNMRRFWSVLTRADLPTDSLKDLHVAVLGLGDSR